MSWKSVSCLVLLFLLFSLQLATAQSQSAPFLYQALLYSAVQSNGQFPGIYTYNGTAAVNLKSGANVNELFIPGNFSASTGSHSIVGLTSSLNVSMATALSVIPLASPASGVITKIDPATGAELPASSTLGPIFTERGETIGKHKLYIGFSSQDFQFTSFNGQSLKPLHLLDVAGDSSNVTAGSTLRSFPATSDLQMNVRLAQDVAFLTYGVTNRFDVSVGLPIVHAGITASTSNLRIYVGNGFANASGINSSYGNGSGLGNCWCVDTLTPGVAPSKDVNLSGLVIPGVINTSSLTKTGFGDMLLRFKGTVLEKRKAVLALGTDIRVPTGDERNFLGTGAAAVKPFLALSLYTEPLNNWLVFSPHLNVGWQFAGKSILGGDLTPTQVGSAPAALGTPLVAHKDYLPDVFSWAVGTEVALGKRNTVVLDVLGDQIGWVHGIPNMALASVPNVPAPSIGGPALVTASGFVTAGRASFGEYSGAFGYKARIVGNLVATLNVLVRFDRNGLAAQPAPLVGLSYTF